MLIAQLLFSCGLKLHCLRDMEVDQYLPWLVTPKREHLDKIEVIFKYKIKNGKSYCSCPFLAENKVICDLQN